MNGKWSRLLAAATMIVSQASPGLGATVAAPGASGTAAAPVALSANAVAGISEQHPEITAAPELALPSAPGVVLEQAPAAQPSAAVPAPAVESLARAGVIEPPRAELGQHAEPTASGRQDPVGAVARPFQGASRELAPLERGFAEALRQGSAAEPGPASEAYLSVSRPYDNPARLAGGEGQDPVAAQSGLLQGGLGAARLDPAAEGGTPGADANVPGRTGVEALQADEGMWTFDNPPLQQLESLYGFVPSKEWLDRVRLAALRFNTGGSGSFVSPDGLVLTNHHVALNQLSKMSSKDLDYVKDGFYARQRSEEIRVPDLEINQLVSMENVTERVLSAIAAGASDKEANEQRKAAMAAIEKESLDRTGLRSNVVELYQGGEYWLYRHKKYTDVRLVMAPEFGAAFFGGDHDNFTYPRFVLDFAFFRIYEDGKPVRPASYFPFSQEGAKEGELTFVAGHPGNTDRLLTTAQLRFQRDVAMPQRLRMYRARREAALRYAARGPEQARRVQDTIFSLENGIKALTGQHRSLQQKELFERKEAAERDLRDRVAADPGLSASYGGAWDRIEAVQGELAKGFKAYAFRNLSGRRLPGIANAIVRYVAEVGKPNERRYEEYRESALESLRFQLFSPAPIYADMEEALLAQGLEESLRELGPEDPFVQAALQGRTPAEVAHEAVAGTRLADVEFRKSLVEGGPAAVAASDDPLIRLARALDPYYRERRAWYEDTVQSVERLEGNKIARARFAIYGKNVPPDATFTLRLSYGQPLGYAWGETRVPYKTTFGGLFDRADSFDGEPPFNVSEKVAAARRKLVLGTPLNMVTTHDTIGGNSGSPVINRAAELVGLIFDSNIQGLGGRFAYARANGGAGRAIAVHSKAILEALGSIYGMHALLEELGLASMTDGAPKVEQLTDGIVHVNFPTRYLLTSTFLRFQEHYESPRFKGQAFSLEQFMDWYAQEMGNFTYYQDWSGFNIPSYVLEPFLEGKFDPLSEKEKALLELLKDRKGKFYVIGTSGNRSRATLIHEISHGLFYTNDAYREEVLAVLRELDLSAIERFLVGQGYDRSVLLDEAHAFLGDLESFGRRSGLDTAPYVEAHKKLVAIFNKHYRPPKP